MDYKKTYEELNVLSPFSPDVKVQQDGKDGSDGLPSHPPF